MNQLQRLSPALSRHGLCQALAGERTPTSVPLEATADLDRVRAAIEALTEELDSPLSSATDSILAPVVHQALGHLPRRVLLDMQFWQWLTVVEFREYTQRRWAHGLVVTTHSELSSGTAERFLGRPNLVGVARNALSRLFWCVETLDDASSNYELTQRMLGRQDLFVGVFEREIGLIPAVARACARTLPDLSEDERRIALRRLLLRGSALSLETVSEDEVAALLTG
ncbi:DUF6339 family protein [Knoellia sp. 3-2P3]|uniref:DUF6339 family protein n=1 Tax=unclassified Knoellia TaxID=2618719 RepID=UPI0023DA132A|nr:DUF6339 family protein [Knoellia sp. 3-2P3]MDF2092597.1 DUF6339 family protein [Knoellia sp. 3-2P3]